MIMDICAEDVINFSNISLNEEDKTFHSIIGHIEDILMEHKFIETHTHFMEKYWMEFDDSEENKLIYMDIFKEYVDTIEKHLGEELLKKEPAFDMDKFVENLKSRDNELEGEIFDLLSTFTDFCAFKAMFLDYKAMKDGKMIDFSSDLCVLKISIPEDI